MGGRPCCEWVWLRYGLRPRKPRAVRPVAATVTVKPTVARRATLLVRMGTVTEVAPAGTVTDVTVGQAIDG